MTYTEPKITLVHDDDGHIKMRTDSGEYARILKDSISQTGDRLTTLEVRFYRGVLAEFNTHRVFSRNSASSRAIPIKKMIKMVLEDPYVPSYWGKNQSGMQSRSEVEDTKEAVKKWFVARDNAIVSALKLLYGSQAPSRPLKDMKEMVDELLELPLPEDALHKQIINRVLEPFMWHTVIISSTEFDNFFDLRAHEDADPAIQQIAYAMKKAVDLSLPMPLEPGEWHLPLVTPEEEETLLSFSKAHARHVSAARCARVSYLTHDGVRDFEKDLDLFDKLVRGKPHLSPLEHVATPTEEDFYGEKKLEGNFTGWTQLRGLLF